MRLHAEIIILNILIFALLIICFTSANGQEEEYNQKLLKEIFEKGLVDSEFVFGKWDTSGNEETHLKYLGELKTTDGKVFKVINESFHWGYSRHATSRILIFKGDNKFVGEYEVNSIFELPIKLSNGKLLFLNKEADCDKNLRNEIDFTGGVPKRIFLKCKGENGDLYILQEHNEK